MDHSRHFEILLAEMAVYLLLWLWNDYMATYLSLIFGTIFLLVLLVSLIVEWIERSKVPSWYYRFMVVSILAPILAAAVYVMLAGPPDWMGNAG